MTWNEIFNSLHSSTSTSLTPFLIHIVDVAPLYVLLVHDLPKFSKVLVNRSSVEALSSFGVKARRFTESQMRVSFEKSSVPFWRGLLPDDFLDLVKKCLFTEWAASFTSVLDPITQHILLGVSEMLLLLLRVAGRTVSAS